jgi:excisionase family DNA binding protein
MENLLTVHEIAQKLRVDDTTVRRWIKSGELKAVVIPRKGIRTVYRVRQVDLDKIL